MLVSEMYCKEILYLWDKWNKTKSQVFKSQRIAVLSHYYSVTNVLLFKTVDQSIFVVMLVFCSSATEVSQCWVQSVTTVLWNYANVSPFTFSDFTYTYIKCTYCVTKILILITCWLKLLYNDAYVA